MIASKRFLRPLVTTLTALALTAGPFVDAALAAEYESKLRLRYDDGVFTGRLKSDKPDCIKHRSVKLVKKVPGKNQVVTRTVTDENGTFAIFGDPDTAGEFYAVAARKDSGSDLCLRDRSNSVRV